MRSPSESQGRAEEGAGATPAPLPLHPFCWGGHVHPAPLLLGGTLLSVVPCPTVPVGTCGPPLGAWVTPRGSAELARLGVLRSQLQLRFLPPLLMAQLEGFLAGSCHCLLDRLPPRASFLLPSQLPANCIPLWVNHPGPACCPAGPVLLLGPQSCPQNEPQALASHRKPQKAPLGSRSPSWAFTVCPDWCRRS